MKIAATSASFGPRNAANRRTQLEWLDACANELEADGVLFDLADFPRTDGEYAAQLKKTCTDLGLAVAGLDARDAAWEAQGDGALDLALALGAPLLVASAPAESDRADAWGAFLAAAKERARAAKARNVTLAIRSAPHTLCPDGGALERLAKDVDSAWLRFAPDVAALAADPTLLATSVIAHYAIADPARFARNDDPDAAALIDALKRFRGFLALSLATAPPTPTAYHEAIVRFQHARATTLNEPA